MRWASNANQMHSLGDQLIPFAWLGEAKFAYPVRPRSKSTLRQGRQIYMETDIRVWKLDTHGKKRVDFFDEDVIEYGDMPLVKQTNRASRKDHQKAKDIGKSTFKR